MRIVCSDTSSRSWGIAWRDTGDRVSIERGFELLDGLSGGGGAAAGLVVSLFAFRNGRRVLCICFED